MRLLSCPFPLAMTTSLLLEWLPMPWDLSLLKPTFPTCATGWRQPQCTILHRSWNMLIYAALLPLEWDNSEVYAGFLNFHRELTLRASTFHWLPSFPASHFSIVLLVFTSSYKWTTHTPALTSWSASWVTQTNSHNGTLESYCWNEHEKRFLKEA